MWFGKRNFAPAVEHRLFSGGKPRIAVVMCNTLAAGGLAALIESVMPGVEVCVFGGMGEIRADELPGFVHYFISADILFGNSAFFRENSHKTIVVTEGAKSAAVPAEFRTIDATLDGRSLLREFLKMEQKAHGGGRHLPSSLRRHPAGGEAMQELTPREVEVLREVVMGNINKEIAAHLNISLATVVTHRKNIMDKLHAKSVATLAIYAVTHGLVSADKI